MKNTTAVMALAMVMTTGLGLAEDSTQKTAMELAAWQSATRRSLGDVTLHFTLKERRDVRNGGIGSVGLTGQHAEDYWSGNYSRWNPLVHQESRWLILSPNTVERLPAGGVGESVVSRRLKTLTLLRSAENSSAKLHGIAGCRYRVVADPDGDDAEEQGAELCWRGLMSSRPRHVAYCRVTDGIASIERRTFVTSWRTVCG